jgi:hypothetical protein
MKWQMSIEGRDSFSWTSSPVSNSTSFDARVAEDDVKNSNIAVWRDRDVFLSVRIFSQQASILIIPYLVSARC